MKLIRSILRYIALILVLGGVIIISFEYYKNKAVFNILTSSVEVRESMGILKIMGLALLGIVIGLLIFIMSMKLSSIIRKRERERAVELEEREKENRETAMRLQKEADEAKKEAEQARKEAEKMKEALDAAEENKEHI